MRFVIPSHFCFQNIIPKAKLETREAWSKLGGIFFFFLSNRV
jgi:hypothetical protein